MNIEKFKESKSLLGHSQQLRDMLMQSQQTQSMSQEQPQMAQVDAPQEAQNAPEQTQPPIASPTPSEPEILQEPKGLVKTIKDTISPYIEEIKSLITKQGKETKQVEVKIEGEMSPKEEEPPVAKAEN